MTPAEYRTLVAEVANRILVLYDEADVKPCPEVAMATALVFVMSARHSGMTREACVEAIGDAFDNCDFYMKGEMPPDAPPQTVYYLVVRVPSEHHLQTFQTRGAAELFIRSNRSAAPYLGELEVREVPIA